MHRLSLSWILAAACLAATFGVAAQPYPNKPVKIIIPWVSGGAVEALVRVVANTADDRLALAAQKAGLPLTVLESPRKVPGDALKEDCDLIVAAHTHAFVTPEALARARIVRAALIAASIPASKIKATTCLTCFAGDNGTEEGKRQNRRAEIAITKG